MRYLLLLSLIGCVHVKYYPMQTGGPYYCSQDGNSMTCLDFDQFMEYIKKHLEADKSVRF